MFVCGIFITFAAITTIENETLQIDNSRHFYIDILR